MNLMAEEPVRVLFEIQTPLGFSVRTTESYWDIIITMKHPVMSGKENDVQNSLRHPNEIRRSLRDPSVYLFYKGKTRSRWVCAVAKRLNGEGFIITAYLTDTIKEGERVWPR